MKYMIDRVSCYDAERDEHVIEGAVFEEITTPIVKSIDGSDMNTGLNKITIYDDYME